MKLCYYTLKVQSFILLTLFSEQNGIKMLYLGSVYPFSTNALVFVRPRKYQEHPGNFTNFCEKPQRVRWPTRYCTNNRNRTPVGQEIISVDFVALQRQTDSDNGVRKPTSQSTTSAHCL